MPPGNDSVEHDEDSKGEPEEERDDGEEINLKCFIHDQNLTSITISIMRSRITMRMVVMIVVSTMTMNLCPGWVDIGGAGWGLWIGFVICNCQPLNIIHSDDDDDDTLLIMHHNVDDEGERGLEREWG